MKTPPPNVVAALQAVYDAPADKVHEEASAFWRTLDIGDEPQSWRVHADSECVLTVQWSDGRPPECDPYNPGKPVAWLYVYANHELVWGNEDDDWQRWLGKPLEAE